MEDLLCTACDKGFKDKSPPKMLECGHNVCAKCLEKFLDSDSVTRCAICQEEITKKESWPTNHSLLNLSKLYKKLLNDKKHVKTAIAYFEEDFVKKEVDDTLGSIRKKITALTKEMENALGSIGTYAETAKVEETLKLDDFEDPEDYLDEVSQRCKTGLVYAIYIIGTEQKFGKVTLFGNKIRVHCASESIPKQERNLTLVLFQDLKDSIGAGNFNAFLRISCNKFGLEYLVEVDLTPNELLLQFVKLCTGETGPSYKGTLYHKGNSDRDGEALLYIDNYISNGKRNTGQIDYNLNYRTKTSCKAGEYVVDGLDDGTFGIIKMESDVEYSNILGKIVPPCNFLHEICYDSKIDNKTLDCGIIFQVE